MKKYEHTLINHNIKTESKSKLPLWQTEITSLPTSDIYRQFKSRVKFESSLSDIRNKKYRVIFTKSRLQGRIQGGGGGGGATTLTSHPPPPPCFRTGSTGAPRLCSRQRRLVRSFVTHFSRNPFFTFF